MSVRLQKFLAQAGVASRRSAEEMILSGRVSVNGRTVDILGSKVDTGDDVRVDGKTVAVATGKRYIMLHKPAGYVTTLHDPQGRLTVRDLLRSESERLYPVGRLDYDSEGLLLMTNDGDFAYHLQHPRFGVPKTYCLEVEGPVSDDDIKRLAAGIHLTDGWFKPSKVHFETRRTSYPRLYLTIAEGRNRVIRRAMDLLGYPVRRLIRLEIGGVHLGDLKKGEFRDLTPSERDTLMIFLKKFS